MKKLANIAMIALALLVVTPVSAQAEAPFERTVHTSQVEVTPVMHSVMNSNAIGSVPGK